MAQPRPHPEDTEPPPPLVLRLRLWDPFPPRQATAPLQQALRQRLPPVKPMLDLTALTDLLGPRDVIRGLSSSSRHLAEASPASRCRARCARPPPSRFATRCRRHAAPRCLASVAAR